MLLCPSYVYKYVYINKLFKKCFIHMHVCIMYDLCTYKTTKMSSVRKCTYQNGDGRKISKNIQTIPKKVYLPTIQNN